MARALRLDSPALTTIQGMHEFIASLMSAMDASKARLWALYLQHRELSDQDFATSIVPTLAKGSPEVALLYKLRKGTIGSQEQLLEEVGRW